MATDMVTRLICNELNLRAYTAVTLNTVNEIIRIHNPTPNGAYALARVITAAALMSATLKPESEQNLTVKFSGSGPAKEIYAQTDASGNMRAYIANPNVDLDEDIGKISFSRTIGAGFLTITKDIGLKEPYSGVTPIEFGEVAADIAYYLTLSEQSPSAVIIGINMNDNFEIYSAGGILIQTFPDTKEEAIIRIEDNIKNAGESLADFIAKGEPILSYLDKIFDGKKTEITGAYPLAPNCRCSRELTGKILESLSIHDLEEMINHDKGAEISCTFCRKAYHFSETELQGMISSRK